VAQGVRPECLKSGALSDAPSPLTPRRAPGFRFRVGDFISSEQNLKTEKKKDLKDFSLVPSKYIEFINRDENIDFDDKMKSLQSEFSDLLKAEEKSKKDLFNVFKELGYEIKL
jgi:hypothetical protein